MAAEAALKGKKIDQAVAFEAAEAALADAKPMSGNAHKVQVAKTALRRAIMKAMAKSVYAYESPSAQPHDWLA